MVSVRIYLSSSSSLGVCKLSALLLCTLTVLPDEHHITPRQANSSYSTAHTTLLGPEVRTVTIEFLPALQDVHDTVETKLISFQVKLLLWCARRHQVPECK
ncbi:hypothetical protein BDW22DRAFT_1361626 [Trametopsis cervina]|nr:hypothetical protein BDW22DRAFT_1361626 [Trametopsis cervina]